jgi:protein-L-isoaspartate(D-aspartate) O-methyltransferase
VVADDGAVLHTGQREWLEAVYSDTALLTQTAPAGDGEQELPTSSSSRPAVMAVMLEALDTRIGHRVLEVGTGTGYNTALLCHRLGEGNVCSVDIHPELIQQAREHLAEIGCHPCLTTGDGTNGWAERAPFDRILATCAITWIPPEWIRQLADGGRIVAPLDAGTAGPLLVLDKIAAAEVAGRIDPYPAAWFMPLREHVERPLGPGQSTGFTAAGMAHYGTTVLDPASLLADDPDRSRFGVTALDDPNRQYVWLDDPNGPHSFPLPTPDGK